MEEEFDEQVEEQAKEHLGENLAPAVENMAEKTLQEFSAPTTTNIRTGPAVNTRENGFELKLLSLPWFKTANSMEKLMKMQVHTYNIF